VESLERDISGARPDLERRLFSDADRSAFVAYSVDADTARTWTQEGYSRGKRDVERERMMKTYFKRRMDTLVEYAKQDESGGKAQKTE